MPAGTATRAVPPKLPRPVVGAPCTCTVQPLAMFAVSEPSSPALRKAPVPVPGSVQRDVVEQVGVPAAEPACALAVPATDALPPERFAPLGLTSTVPALLSMPPASVSAAVVESPIFRVAPLWTSSVGVEEGPPA